MAQKLLYWDNNMATPAERRLAMAENLESGIPDLVEAARRYYAAEGKPLPEGQSSVAPSGSGKMAVA
jgi:hypothetical protein